MLISREAVAGFRARELDDWRWVKALSEERLWDELSLLRVRPRFRRKPWLHQLACFYVAMLNPRFMLLLDMGAGKTQIVSDVYAQRLREGKADRGLIAVPRYVNVDTWVRDLAKSSDLEPIRVDVESVEEKWELLRRGRGQLAIVDFSGLMLALSQKVPRRKRKKGQSDNELVPHKERIAELLQRYNFLGVDEIHQVGANHNSLPYDILDRISAGCDYAYGTTGTLFGRNPEAAWGPFRMIDRGETLGERLGPFRGAFFETKVHPWKGPQYVFRKSMTEALGTTLQHRSLRYEEAEMHDLPPKVPRERVVEMGAEQRGHYMRALEGLISAGGDLREMDGAYTRMRQIVSGYLVWKDDDGGEQRLLRFKDNPRLEQLVADVGEASDSKVVVVYWYTETGRLVVDRLREEGHAVQWLYGGTKDRKGLMDDVLDPRGSSVLVMQAVVGGTGTDGLQDVARYALMYETPTSPTTRRQTEKRIGRPGQTRRWFVYDYVARRSCDRGILTDIQDGIDTHEAVMRGRKRGRGFFLAE